MKTEPENKPLSEMNFDEIVEKYIELRNLKSAAKKQYDERVALLEGGMKKLEAAVLERFREQGVESCNTSSGTVYKTTRTSATVADWGAYTLFVSRRLAGAVAQDLSLPPEVVDVIAKALADSGEFEFFERRAAKDPVKEFMEEHQGDLPAGINWNAFTTIGVRAA